MGSTVSADFASLRSSRGAFMSKKKKIGQPGSTRHPPAIGLPLISLALGGCAQRGAPSLALFGAYFPAWMLCALFGILMALAARTVFVASGLSDVL
ncbi:MAG TPA: YtcA family lipoprotein, partial [Variovorax sp.]